MDKPQVTALRKCQNPTVQRITFKTTSKQKGEQLELEDDMGTEPNLILAVEPLMKLCERLESNKGLCPVCLAINQTCGY